MTGLTSPGAARTAWGYAIVLVEIAGLLGLIVVIRIWVAPYLGSTGLPELVASWGVLAPAAFVALAAVVEMSPVPGILVVALGALTFGALPGAIYTVGGRTAGAGGAFLVGRYLLNDLAARMREKHLWKRGMSTADSMAQRHGILTVIGLRCVFLKGFVLDYATGTTSLKLTHFVVGTAVGLMPRVFIFSYLVEKAGVLAPASVMPLGSSLVLLGLVSSTRVGGALLLARLATLDRGGTRSLDAS